MYPCLEQPVTTQLKAWRHLWTLSWNFYIYPAFDGASIALSAHIILDFQELFPQRYDRSLYP